MQHKGLSKVLNLSLAVFLSFTCPATASLSCPTCGPMQVPFPLSTSPTCGDQLYKVRCTNGTLWLDTLYDSSYVVTSITPDIQELIIRPQSFDGSKCINTDFKSGGLWLDRNLPFNISSKNTVLKFNCKPLAFISAMNCSSTNIAFRYDPAHSLFSLSLAAVKPVRKWSEPGIQIQWDKPLEPLCTLPADCKGLPNSTCLPDHAAAGKKRCFCNKGLEWNSINAICQIAKKCKGNHCPHHIDRKKLYQGLTFSACGLVIIGIFIVLVKQHQKHLKREARRKLVKEREEILNSNNHGKTAKLFSGKEMKRSTNNFSKENLLGTGGFGEVYKASLDESSLAAIKKAKNGNTLGMDQVLNEVSVLCQVNHRSLVQLLGTCLDLDQPVLVYEYVANGTLFDHLHGRYSNQWGTLTWQRRLLIAKQTADGLAYLHFSAVPPIFHRDIKSSNILLNEKLDAKVSDFGLSRLVDTEGTHISTCAQGTLGYLDPEYYQNYQLTDRSDVYSFGVVILELLTSQKAIDFNRDDDVNLAVYVSQLADNDRLLDAVDSGLKKHASNLEFETMKAFGLLAVACVDEQRKNRPSMREVAEELEYIISIIDKHPNSLL